jgi:adenylate cyclase
MAQPRWGLNRSALLVAALVAVAAALAARAGLLAALEARTVDARFQWRGPLPDGARQGIVPIVIVEISDLTYEIFREPRTFWGAHYARAIRRLHAAGARVIALDVVPATPVARYAPELDEQLAEALIETSGLILIRTRTMLPDGSVRVLHPHLQLLTALQLGGGALGYNTLTPDRDGVVRWQRLATSAPEPELELALYVAARALGVSPDVEPDGRLMLGKVELPRQSGWGVGINFRGPARSYRHLGLEAVAGPDAIADAELEALVAGAIVLVGSTSLADQDVHAVPMADAAGRRLMPGVEIHANTVATILGADAILAVPLHWKMSGLVAAALALSWIFTCASLPLGLFVLGAFGAGWAAVCMAAFHAAWALPLALPLATGAAAFAGIYGLRFVTVQREKQQLRSLFEKSVSKAVVDALIADPRLARLEGERRELTVLFSDIRNFTTLSEGMDPQRLSSLLNRYLTVMTRIVLRHDGTVDKYIGDAIMALFGAPVAHRDDPARAVRCAVEMTEALRELRQAWLAEGLSEAADFDIGIGVHTGEAFVGTVGAPERMEYTALGDTVNVASRLEGLNKQMQTSILISGATYRHVGDLVQTGRTEVLAVKGRGRPVEVLEVVGLAGTAARPRAISPQEAEP